MKPRLISGIQPSGKLHIGNYLGALKNFVELQNSGKYDCFFFIADLHSLTEPSTWKTPKDKNRQIEDVILSYLATGLDAKKSVLFLQSSVHAHAELAWILNTITPMGELMRMTQFKEKSDSNTENTGLFTYPVLMSADILLYDAKFVPVGDDQLQHLELARTLARKFNGRFGKTFVEPKPLLTATPRLMSLDNPLKKMSKSRPEGCLFLDDAPKIIEEKIKRAVTDSGSTIECNPEGKPAISNLLLIYSSISGSPIAELENRYKNKGYAEFKSDLAKAIVSLLSPIQKKKRELKKEMPKIFQMLEKNNKIAENVANKKYGDVKRKVGISI